METVAEIMHVPTLYIGGMQYCCNCHRPIPVPFSNRKILCKDCSPFGRRDFNFTIGIEPLEARLLEEDSSQ